MTQDALDMRGLIVTKAAGSVRVGTNPVGKVVAAGGLVGRDLVGKILAARGLVRRDLVGRNLIGKMLAAGGLIGRDIVGTVLIQGNAPRRILIIERNTTLAEIKHGQKRPIPRTCKQQQRAKNHRSGAKNRPFGPDIFLL